MRICNSQKLSTTQPPYFYRTRQVVGGAEGQQIVRIRIRSHINLNFILQQSLTAFGGAPFAQGSLSCYHAFGLLDKAKFIPPSIDTHRPPLSLPPDHRLPQSPWLSLRESWREAPERAHCIDSTHKPPTDPPHRSHPQPPQQTHRTPPWVSLCLPKILGGKLQGFWGKTANILATEQAITVLKASTFKDICVVRYTFFTEKG